MNSEELPFILCVDDEPRVLDSLVANLRRYYNVLTANGAHTALQVLKDRAAPAVVVSDMRMSGMDGATFLKQVKHLYPETTRVLLTGDPGRDAAVAAVNQGQIFRFLTKPCPPDALRAAIDAGVIHHRLLTAEKVLLQETLIGCIGALVDVLAITNPVAFGRTTRVRRLATELAATVGYQKFWQLEAAAMLSQIGYVSLPVELVEKSYYGERLTPEERVLMGGVPLVARKLLGRIPRLEPVMDILAASQDSVNDVPAGLIKEGSDILRLVLEYDAQVARGHPISQAIQTMRAQTAKHDGKLIGNLETLVGASVSAQEIGQIELGRVRPGMIFMDDLHTHIGTLLVPKGFEVTEIFLERAQNFGPGILQEKVRVLIP